MTISDLNPIQFWPVAKQTFNEKIEPGIDRARFVYTPYLNDVQLLQVLSVDPVWLVTYDADLVAIKIQAFTETSVGSGIWNLSFTGAGFSSTCVYLKIGTVTNLIANSSFTATLAPWSDAGGPNDVWVWDATNSAKIVFTASISNKLIQAFAVQPAGIYSYSFTCKNSILLRSTTVTIEAYSGATLVATIATIGETAVANHTHSGQFIANVSFDNIKISANDIFFAADYYFLLNDFSLSTPVAVLKSDMIFFSDEVFETQLLQYSNINNYAGIDYTNAEKFCLRVPAKFYEERQPEEDESEALSDSSIVKLAGTVKRQKYLEIEPLPPYMILKLKLILKHNSLKVDEDYYIQEETMDVTKLNDRFAMFLSKVWLTLRDNGYFTNVYGASVSLNQTSGLPDPMIDFTSGVTYFGEPEAASVETYIGPPEIAHAETFLGGTIDEGGETYIGAPSVQHAELVFADGAQESELTYIGDASYRHPGWGCILDACQFTDANAVLWDDGDALQWDDGDNVDND